MEPDEDPKYPVFLHIYDISQGMARSMSQMFLGKQIDGIYHTGIVVYGQEYYFGGGICSGPPKQTPFGFPNKIEQIGETQIPKEIFLEFLRELSPKFSVATYDLLKNNCNNFTEECCQFLTGTSIPSYIIGLPSEVLSTPFGKMIEPIITNLQNQMLRDTNNQLLPGMLEANNMNPQALNFNVPINNPNNYNNIPQPAFNNNNREPVEEIVSALQFREAILTNKAVVIDFYSLTCGPCKRIKPIYHSIAQETSNIRFFSCQNKNHPDIAVQLQIKSVPTFIFYHNGSILHRFSGAHEAELRKYVNTLKSLVGSASTQSQSNFQPPIQEKIEKKSPYALCNPESYEFYLYKVEKKDFPVNKIKSMTPEKIRNNDDYDTFIELAVNVDAAIQYFIPEKKKSLLNFLLKNLLSYIDNFSMDEVPFFDLFRMLLGEASYCEIFFENFKQSIEKFFSYLKNDIESGFKAIEKPIRVLLLRVLCNGFASEAGKVELMKKSSQLHEIAGKYLDFFMKIDKMTVESCIMLDLNMLLTKKIEKNEFSVILKNCLSTAGLSIENSNDIINFGVVLAVNSICWNEKNLVETVKEMGIEKFLEKIKVSKNEKLVLAGKDCENIITGKLK